MDLGAAIRRGVAWRWIIPADKEVTMARRSRKSDGEEFVFILAKLPWWLNVGLAIGSYFLLHRIAVAPPPVTTETREIGQMVSGQVVRMFGIFGQYLLPLLLSFAAIVSATTRRKRRRLHSRAATSANATALNQMSWQEFEMLVGEAFRQRGYSIMENGGGGADGGVDLVLRRDGERFLVQCKQWKTKKVGVKIVRELYGVMAAEGVGGGFVVTSGVFTQEAIEFASGKEIELIDGSQLLGLIRDAERGGKERLGKRRGNTPRASGLGDTAEETSPPSCPRCGHAMVVRVAKRGKQVGKRFWGCPDFPSCRGTVVIDEPT